MTVLKAKQHFGKYVIEKKLGEGGFAIVYQARDTIEGIRVALKIPYAHLVTDESLDVFRQEVRLVAKLDHPNIQPLKYADYIDGHFVIVTALGLGTLDDRLAKRIAVKTSLDFSAQMLSSVACAHENKIIHCDIKPDNFLVFPENQLRLTDFGIARVAHKTLRGSGAGTLGYIAPEQAMGRPSFRSDVFSLGIVMYRLFSGRLPEWPYQWPFSGYERLQRSLHQDFIAVLQRATEFEAQRRYRDAAHMLKAFYQVKQPRRENARSPAAVSRKQSTGRWKQVQFREFQREYRKTLETRHSCGKCGGPVAEVMFACPWCGRARKKHPDDSIRFSVACPRCHRGLKSDWKYCAWCYGPGFEPSTKRQLSDRRYAARCSNTSCVRKDLMPFMRYCPWCKFRVKRKWKLDGSHEICGACEWGVAKDYWTYCPWCAKQL